ncbi:MAG: tyrosine-type recombinase/integrase, partial [Acidimicrobiia bacterium]
SDGEHLKYSNWLDRIWYPARGKAGLEWLQFHDLRRANATGLVVEGVDIKTAQTRLGHTDPWLTLGIYAQATNEADRAAAERLGERFLRRQGRDSGRGLA